MNWKTLPPPARAGFICIGLAAAVALHSMVKMEPMAESRAQTPSAPVAAADTDDSAYRVVMSLEEALYVHDCLPIRINYTVVKRLNEDTAGSISACQREWQAKPKAERDLAPRFGHADPYFRKLMIQCLASQDFEADQFATFNLERRVTIATVCRKFAMIHWRRITPPL